MKRSKPEEKLKWADCMYCGVNLEKFTFGGRTGFTNGISCVLCLDQKLTDDLQRRWKYEREKNDKIGVLVDVDKTITRVNLLKAEFKDFIPVYRSALGLQPNLRHVEPMYEFRDHPLNNDFAERIAHESCSFGFDGDRNWMGPILFMGPHETSLLPEELKKFRL